MNLSLKKSGLLIIAGALFFLSCKDSSELLLDTDNDIIKTTLVDTFTITTASVKVDSFKTFAAGGSQNYLLFGKYNDQYLGEISTYSSTEVGLDYDVVTDTSKFVSLAIVLDLDYKAGNFTDDQSLYVYQLKDSVKRTWFYEYKYIASTPGPDILATDPINTKINFNISESKKGKIIFNLNEELGQLFYEHLKSIKSSDSETTKRQNFLTFFKGIRIAGGENNTAVFGAHPDSSHIVLKYQTGSTIHELNFPLSSPSHAVHIDGPASIPSIPNTTFIQSSTGLTTKISFPSVKKLNDLGSNISINKAELIITPEEDNSISPPSNLFLLHHPSWLDTSTFTENLASGILFNNYRAVQTGIIGKHQEDNTSALTLGFNSTKKTYTANITSYIEALLSDSEGQKYPTDLLLYPEGGGNMVSKDIAYFLNPNNPRLLGGFSKDLTINRAVIQSQKIKLKIYYTLVPSHPNR